MPQRFRTLLVVYVVLATALLAVAADRPNVILIMADDMGYECLSTYGSQSYETPRLDQLAAAGIRFDHCYSTPICTPSRVQLMTGRYSSFTYEEFGYLNPKYPTFGNLMRDAGYATMIAGKWQLNGISHGEGKFDRWNDATRIRDAGFDEYSLWQITKGKKFGERFWDPLIEQNGEILDEVLDGKYGPDHFTNYICDFIERKKDEPFFVYYPMVLVHNPFVYTPDSKSPNLTDQEAFADMVAYCDKLVGRIYDQLEKNGLLENTLILFTGDNGTNVALRSDLADRSVQGGKGNTIDAGIHVPFIAYWKGRTPVGLVSSQLIDFTDFNKTLADLVNLPEQEQRNRQFDGVSFLPTLTGKSGPEREWVFCYYDPRWGEAPAENRDKFAYDGRFKLYQNGNYFEVPQDFLEASPLAVDGVPTSIRERLQSALDRYPILPMKQTEFGEPLIPGFTANAGVDD
jgi:arylsulfatase A